MDTSKFDRMVRQFSTGMGRRTLLATLTGTGLVALLELNADAKKKKKRGNKGKGRGNGRNKNSGKDSGGNTTLSTLTGPSVTPTPHDGNFNNCPSDVKGYKVDNNPRGKGFTIIGTDCGDCKIAHDVYDEGRYLSFEVVDGDCVIYNVYVKGGNAYNHYYYPNGTSGDSGLRAPDNNGGNIPGISHFNVCDIDCPVCEPKTCKDFSGCGSFDPGCGQPNIECGCPDGDYCDEGTCKHCPTKDDCEEGTCGPLNVPGACDPVTCTCPNGQNCNEQSGTCEEVCVNPTSCDPNAKEGDPYYTPCCTGYSCRRESAYSTYQCLAISR